MADRITAEQLDLLADTDPIRLRDEAIKLLTQVEQLTERMAVVEEFVAARAEYITAINNCAPGNYADYHRWQGHAEGRRQLAQELGLPVAWPPEYERTPGA